MKFWVKEHNNFQQETIVYEVKEGKYDTNKKSSKMQIKMLMRRLNSFCTFFSLEEHYMTQYKNNKKIKEEKGRNNVITESQIMHNTNA